jgi:hypothetical protein
MFTVRWEEQAVNELTTLWVNATSEERKKITACSHKVDQLLQANASDEGESRVDDQRLLFVLPLAVVFKVEEDGHTVSVLQVRMIRSRKK